MRAIYELRAGCADRLEAAASAAIVWIVRGIVAEIHVTAHQAFIVVDLIIQASEDELVSLRKRNETDIAGGQSQGRGIGGDRSTLNGRQRTVALLGSTEEEQLVFLDGAAAGKERIAQFQARLGRRGAAAGRGGHAGSAEQVLGAGMPLVGAGVGD